MELQEAIEHIEEVIKNMSCEECKKEHMQLKEWLVELMGRRNKDGCEK